MLFRRLCTSLARSDLSPPSFHRKLPSPYTVPSPFTVPSSRTSLLLTPNRHNLKFPRLNSATPRFFSSKNQMGDSRRPLSVPIPEVETADRAELLRALETALGTSFTSQPLVHPPNPLIVVISGPSGVGKDAVIKRLREVREGIHFVVTATSRAKRSGEVDGVDYYFVSKEEFLSMVEKDELLEYALVYGDYKGIPKQQIREYMAKGCDIVLRVDIQGAATLRKILGNSAVFIFLVAESELALVNRLIDRKTETKETLLVRIATAREEVKHVKNFDYVVVNAEGKLESAVKMVESVIDAEKAKVRQRSAFV